MRQHSPSIVLGAWAAIYVAGCHWILPMLIVFFASLGLATYEYLKP